MVHHQGINNHNVQEPMSRLALVFGPLVPLILHRNYDNLKMIMKIAIPTNDGLNIEPVFEEARGILVISFELGEIVQEEMRWNKLQDILTSGEGFFCTCKDCDTILVNTISDRFEGVLTTKGKKVHHTHEKIITRALVNYMQEQLRREPDYCCCP